VREKVNLLSFVLSWSFSDVYPPLLTFYLFAPAWLNGSIMGRYEALYLH